MDTVDAWYAAYQRTNSFRLFLLQDDEIVLLKERYYYDFKLIRKINQILNLQEEKEEKHCCCIQKLFY